jgi:hypothetical protein
VGGEASLQDDSTNQLAAGPLQLLEAMNDLNDTMDTIFGQLDTSGSSLEPRISSG